VLTFLVACSLNFVPHPLLPPPLARALQLFALSYNPDRRPGLSSNNSGLEPTLSHRGERRNARPTAGGERSTTGSDRPLNSPARERFGGIEGGVLGGIGRGPGSGVAGEGKLGGLGARGERGTRERRTLKDGESGGWPPEQLHTPTCSLMLPPPL
jgi:hypothetical protein